LVTCLASPIVFPAVAFGAGSRIHSSVNHVLVKIVATVRQVPFGRIRVFIARLDLFAMGMAVGAERFRMTGGAGHSLALSVEAMLLIELSRLVIERLPLVGMAFAAIGHPRNLHRVHPGKAGGVRAGVEQGQEQRGH